MLSWIRSWWSRPPTITVEADPAPQLILPRSIALADDPPTSLISYLEALKGDKKAPKSPKSSKYSKHETV